MGNPQSSYNDSIHRFRAKLTPELAAIVKSSPAVARQFLPDANESMDFGGTETPFEEGKLNHGIYGLERLYVDRAVITPYFECSAYCRFCFKKTRTLAGDGKRMTNQDIEQAIEFIRNDPRICTVLISGGDPLVDLPLLKHVLDRVVTIPHVTSIRVGTRNILFHPDHLTHDVADLLASYNHIDYENLKRSRSFSMAFSLNHPDEITPAVTRAVRRLVSRGVVVRGQVTLLKGVNDDVSALRDLYSLFAAIGMVPYYISHCMPVVGAAHFRTSVQRGLDLLAELAPLTGALAPTYIYVTQVGKHRLGLGQALQHVQIQNNNYIRAKSVYLATDFFTCTGKTDLPPLHSISEDGYIITNYLDGDD
jgi:lysine 2,3-aminomutase